MGETPLRSNHFKIEKKKPYLMITIAFLALVFIVASLYWYIYQLPYFQKVALNPTNETKIYFMGTEIEDSQAVVKEGMVYIPFVFVQKYIDSTIQWDEDKQVVILTTDQNIFHFPLGKRDGLLNLDPYKFTYPVMEFDSEVYLPIEPLNKYYHFKENYIDESNVLVIRDMQKPIQQGITMEETRLREQPKLMSSWLADINENEQVYILYEQDGWYWLEDSNGQMGFADKDQVKLTSIELAKIEKEVYQPWNPIGKPVILTWEYTNTNKPVDTDRIGELPGLQVLSPTWFELQPDGMINNRADMKYVDWAHQNGYQVWGLFSNSFDLDLTNQMLNDPDLRIKVIKQLLSYVDLYQLDGINLDFENVYLKDKESLVQFVRELTPLMHEKDRTVSIDVTFHSGSENWSMFYDRTKLGEIVDYVIVMGYDEHWSTSPVSGSVASLPWVEKGIKNLLKEVPNDKVILGVPFYTRLWIEEKDDTGKINVSSKAYTMDRAKEWIDQHNVEIQYDSKADQRYVEATEGNLTYKMWVEDDYSMERRIDLVKEYRLAGLAAWRRGFESDGFWQLMTKYFTERP